MIVWYSFFYDSVLVILLDLCPLLDQHLELQSDITILIPIPLNGDDHSTGKALQQYMYLGDLVGKTGRCDEAS